MISLEKARQLALDKIRSVWTVIDDEPVLVEEATRKEKFGWVFVYNSKHYLDSKNVTFALAGNGPIVVDSVFEEVTMLGSSGGIDLQLEKYRATRGHSL